MAATVLHEISSSEQDRIRYENELIFELDYNSGINHALSVGEAKGKAEGRAEGEAKGKAESRYEMAREMKYEGLGIDMIARIAKLTEDEINKL